MSKYRINCTEKQARKAFSLGMELDYAKVYETLAGKSIRIPEDTGEFFSIPTAEEMVGWLEEQEGIRSVEVTESFGWHYRVKKKHDDVEDWIQGTCHTRPEATLASIDAALEYLTNNKK